MNEIEPLNHTGKRRQGKQSTHACHKAGRSISLLQPTSSISRLQATSQDCARHETFPIMSGAVPLQHKLGEPTRIYRESISRSQYRYPSVLRKLEQATRTPTLARWVHKRSAGGGIYCIVLLLPLLCAARNWALTRPARIARISNALPRRGCSSAGRALPSQGRGRGFESLHLHHRAKPLGSLPRVFAIFQALSSTRARSSAG